MNIAILQYNNYFNKTVKKAGETATSYFEAAHEYQTFQIDLNLKPNDEITTSIILNGIRFHPDYLIQYDDSDRVITRWFVIESVFKRGEQYSLTIRRDVIVDNIGAVKSAKALVERGSLRGSDPLIYNNENFSFNQVKKGEILLRDHTKTAWIVGYLASDSTDDDYIQASTETAATYKTVESLGLIFNDDDDPAAGAKMELLNVAYPMCAVKTGEVFGVPAGFAILSRTGASVWSTKGVTGEIENGKWTMMRNSYDYTKERIFSSNYALYTYDRSSTLDSQIETAFGLASAAERETLLSLNGQVVYSTAKSKYYQLKIISETSEYERRSVTTDFNAPLFSTLKSIVQTTIENTYQDGLAFLDPSTYFLEIDISRISVELVEVAAQGLIRTKISNTRNKLTDAPFDMFCMPFNRDNLALAQQIKVELANKIYDIQILPYCPYRALGVDISGGTEHYDYEAIEAYDDDLDDWVDVGYILFPLSSSDSFLISPGSIYADLWIDFSPGTGAMRTKVLDQTQRFRLCSPNYAAAFDFSVTKNGGDVLAFRIDFTYRPISPYIHVAPLFGGIYGYYNNDARGLVLSGDFSIDMISDEWMNYQAQNKNYQNIFNTQIKTMDELHELEMLQRGLTTATGAVVSGAAAGMKTGNALVGAGTAVMAAGAGIFDIAMNQERFNVNRRQVMETFSYQLGNIKALPNTLTKVTAYNVNNKYFPLVEVYGATAQEIKVFREFLTLRGFTIGAFGTLFDYVDYHTFDKPFLKARIVRMDEFRGDSHMAEEIYKEIEEGVYIDGIQ